MSQLQPPLLYVILGAAGSGRKAIVRDLIEGGLSEDEEALVLLADAEPKWDGDGDGDAVRVSTWALQDGMAQLPREQFGDATHIFLVTNGRANPVDQIEALKPWIESGSVELARVITIVNCRLAEQHRELQAWYEACIHFSDAVLLANRDGVPNKWMSDFQNRFKDQFFPCLFEVVKEGRVKNPPLVLEPQARRVSHVFDEPDWEILGEEDEEDEDAEAERETNEEVQVAAETDPYLERRAGGRRVKELPDISKYI